ncbi:MAG: RagB/SusD family nutrient uptake outer membrane protein, partial [Bacteroidales bacterium]|nr:RagB/SusD family nutrient uptake outer membrane protein [Bacteroidales bacterium]
MKRILLLIFLAAFAAGCSSLMETGPSDEVSKDEILKDAEGMAVAIDGIYATMYNRIDFLSANTHQTFGNMAVTLAAELMGEDMVHTAQGAGWFWKDYTYEMRSRYTSNIWRSYFTWKYFYLLISNANYVLSAASTVEGDAARIKNLLAQAYAIRAFSYFGLIRSFQQTLKGHETLPGVPVYTE